MKTGDGAGRVNHEHEQMVRLLCLQNAMHSDFEMQFNRIMSASKQEKPLPVTANARTNGPILVLSKYNFEGSVWVMPLTVDAHHSRLLRLHALNFSTAHAVPSTGTYIQYK